MADSHNGEFTTNDDLEKLMQKVLNQNGPKAIIFNAAVTDAVGKIGDIPSGKSAPRLKSRELKDTPMTLNTARKIIPLIKEQRPDITLVAFKTTSNEDRDDQIKIARNSLRGTNADIVVANDIGTFRNLLINSEGAILFESEGRERDELLSAMVDQTIAISLEKLEQPNQNPALLP